MSLDERRLGADGVTVPILRQAVVDKGMTLGDDRDGKGIHGQLAALIEDLVVGRHILIVFVQDLDRQLVLDGAVPDVYDLGVGHHVGAMSLDERRLGADGMTVIAVSVSVVREGMAFRDDGDRLGNNGQTAVHVGNGVVGRHVLPVGGQYGDQDLVIGRGLGRAVPDVYDLGQGNGLGSVALHQGGLVAEGVAVPAVGISVVDPVVILGDDRDGSGCDR